MILLYFDARCSFQVYIKFEILELIDLLKVCFFIIFEKVGFILIILVLINFFKLMEFVYFK